MTPEDKALVDTIRQRANADQAVDDAEKAHICTTRDVSYTDANAMTEAFRDCCSVRLIGIDGKVRGTTSRQCTRLECPQCEDTISKLKGDRAITLHIIDEQTADISHAHGYAERLESQLAEERAKREAADTILLTNADLIVKLRGRADKAERELAELKRPVMPCGHRDCLPHACALL